MRCRSKTFNEAAHGLIEAIHSHDVGHTVEYLQMNLCKGVRKILKVRMGKDLSRFIVFLHVPSLPFRTFE